MNNPYILMCISDINKRKETLQEKNKKWTKELQDGKMNILDQLITKKDIHTNQKRNKLFLYNMFPSISLVKLSDVKNEI